MAKIYGQLIRAQLENVTAVPSLGITGRAVVNTSTNKVHIDNGATVMEIVGASETQTLTNKTMVAGSNTFSGFLHGTQVNNPSSGVHGVTGSVVGTSDAQVLTSKDYDGGTASNTSRISVPKNSFVNLSALTRKEATFVYDQSNTRMMFDDGVSLQAVGTGTGASSSPNLISNSDALVDTSGWATYKDAAGSQPVDGTGGSPTTVTFSRTTTAGEVLLGSASFKLAKSAANGQGEGFSYDFSMPRAFASTPISLTFNYQTTANFSYANADIVVYVYDVTAGSLIQPIPYQLDGSGKAIMQFQSDSNSSTAYRLVFHIATTNASAYNFIIDNVIVYQNATSPTTYVADATYNLSTLSLITGPAGFSVSRAVAKLNKDRAGIWWMTLNLQFSITSSSSFTITISGANFDDVDNRGPLYLAGNGKFGSACATTPTIITCTINSADTDFGIGGTIRLTSKPSWVVDYPGLVLNDGAIVNDSRVVAIKYRATTAGALTGGTTTYKWTTSVFETHSSAYSAATGVFTCPVMGYYSVSGSILIDNGTSNIYLYKNGSQDTGLVLSSASNYASFATEIFLNVNDTFDIRSIAGANTLTDARSTISIVRMTGSAQILPSEKVQARYYSTATNTFANSTLKINDYATKEIDTHNAVVVGASWAFTAPTQGVYVVFAQVTQTSNSYADKSFQLKVYKNGSEHANGAIYEYSLSVSATRMRAHVNDLVSLNAGDTIDIRGLQDNGNVNTTGVASENFVYIFKQ